MDDDDDDNTNAVNTNGSPEEKDNDGKTPLDRMDYDFPGAGLLKAHAKYGAKHGAPCVLEAATAKDWRGMENLVRCYPDGAKTKVRIEIGMAANTQSAV